jgi:hypothetical protein
MHRNNSRIERFSIEAKLIPIHKTEQLTESTIWVFSEGFQWMEYSTGERREGLMGKLEEIIIRQAAVEPSPFNTPPGVNFTNVLRAAFA